MYLCACVCLIVHVCLQISPTEGSNWDDGVKAVFETEFQVVQLYQTNKHLCSLDALYMQIIFLIGVVIPFVL